MYRAQPVSNRLVTHRYQQQNYALHVKKLIQLKAISPQQPTRYRSLPPDAKRRRIRREESRKIAKCNSQLFDRIYDITMDNSARILPMVQKSRTLNGSRRRSELRRITSENHRLLERLMSKRSNFSLRRWAKEDTERRKYVRFGCMYPYKLSRGNNLSKPDLSATNLLPPVEPQPSQNLHNDTTLPSVMRKSICFPSFIMRILDMQVAGIGPDLQRKLRHPELEVGCTLRQRRIEGRRYDVQVSVLGE